MEAERVKQFFSEEELLIGSRFWNFICDNEEGYKMVIDAYNTYAPTLKAALEEIIAVAKQNTSSEQASLWQDNAP